MGYVDAYYEFEDRPKVTEACDVILSNCYPFWEGCAHPYAILYMQDMYLRLQKVAQGKRIIITETGWPSAGGHFYGAESSPQGAYLYFLKAMEWAAEENIEMFYFSSFDEPWKVAGDAGEGDVGAYWGYGTERALQVRFFAMSRHGVLAHKRAICYRVFAMVRALTRVCSHQGGNYQRFQDLTDTGTPCGLCL